VKSVPPVDNELPPPRARPPNTATTSCTPLDAPSATGRRWPAARSTSANLTPSGLKAYDEAAFFTALRTGVRPGGSKVNEAMPWRRTKEMTDDEIRAVRAYLKTVPPREFGAR
jgi:mono/diheme cytochrome c family protein